MRHVLISSVKDEGPFLLEWVAHHLVLGFDRICIASNDCRDGSDSLLLALDRSGYIRHVPNPVAADEIPQHAGYARIRSLGLVEGAEWLMVLDADEFLNIHVGANGVADLTATAAPDVDIIALNGLCFTDSGEINWQPGRICPRFTQHVGVIHKANTAYKCLTRHPERFRAINNHHMIGFRQKNPLRVMRGDGKVWDIPPEQPIFKALRFSLRRQIRLQLAQYNHYAVKTWDSFQLRQDRGRGAVAAQDGANLRHSDTYFSDRNVARGEDLSIARYGDAVASLMAQMLTVPDIRKAQDNTLERYGQLVARHRR